MLGVIFRKAENKIQDPAKPAPVAGSKPSVWNI
jgi:hypothetical protein